MHAQSSPSLRSDAGADAGVKVIVERPPEGLARGEYPWPDWGIGLIGAIVAVAAFGYLAWRLWQRRR